MSVASHVGPPQGGAARTPAHRPRRPVAGGRRPLGVAGTVALALALAGVSLLVVAPAPSYDPWAWLLWGREIAELELSTAEGPAFKPLPVAVGVLLAGLGDTVAPVAWVWLARTGAVIALVASARLALELSGGSRMVAALAALAVAVTGSFLEHAASGLSEPLLVALALTGVASARDGRPHIALACAAGCALIRVETWPFLLVAGALAWRGWPGLRAPMVLVAGVVPLAWFGPELIGSGDVLRSGSRALIPNPGQPALAPIPALASLQAAIPLVPWPMWAGVAALLYLVPPVSALMAFGLFGETLTPLQIGGMAVAALGVAVASRG